MIHGLRCALLACATLLSCAAVWAGDSRVPQPVIEPARAGTQCIADPATMRRDHPAMLKHQRDATVRGGIRGAKASLKACIACHASPTTGSVAKAETNFCVSCHAYAAVHIDCFDCHATRPQLALAGQLP
jgi:predicted CXXCH cytochrome family protein